MRDIDRITAQLREEIPGIQIEQLQVSHPGADDDGLWFIKAPNSPGDVQIESSYGTCPFIIEGGCTNAAFEGKDVAEVVRIVRNLLEWGSSDGPRWPAT